MNNEPQMNADMQMCSNKSAFINAETLRVLLTET